MVCSNTTSHLFQRQRSNNPHVTGAAKQRYTNATDLWTPTAVSRHSQSKGKPTQWRRVCSVKVNLPNGCVTISFSNLTFAVLCYTFLVYSKVHGEKKRGELIGFGRVCCEGCAYIRKSTWTKDQYMKKQQLPQFLQKRLAFLGQVYFQENNPRFKWQCQWVFFLENNYKRLPKNSISAWNAKLWKLVSD